MNRIDTLFKNKEKNILSIYFTAGFPALEDTNTIITTLAQHQVDMIEIGIPFSDPMADGPVIQHSAANALQNGMTLRKLFEQLKTIRQTVSIPLVLMGYLNPIMQFGFENFCIQAEQCGIDGLIIPDLPFDEYLKNYQSVATAHGLHMSMLITPETSEERIRMIDKHTSGFIYMVSSASVTGVKSVFSNENLDYFKRVRAMNLNNPRLIGFGISNKTTFDTACQYASGAIIGSKFVSLLAEKNNPQIAIQQLKEGLYED